MDFSRLTGEYRLVDNLLPEARINFEEIQKANNAAKKKSRKKGAAATEEVPPEEVPDPGENITTGTWSPEVGILCVKWHPSLNRACLLASGMACGLVRVDWMERSGNERSTNVRGEDVVMEESESNFQCMRRWKRKVLPLSAHEYGLVIRSSGVDATFWAREKALRKRETIRKEKVAARGTHGLSAQAALPTHILLSLLNIRSPALPDSDELHLTFPHYIVKSRQLRAKRMMPSTTIASFPTEILAHIVQLSSPPATWDTFSARSTHLRALALSSRVFRSTAQAEIFRHVVLPNLEAAKLYIAVLKTRPGASWANEAKSLRVGQTGVSRFGPAVEMVGLPWIAKKCARLEEMWLIAIGPFDIEQVASGPGIYFSHPFGILKALYCRSCFINNSILDQKRKPPQLSLISLSLSDCRITSLLRVASLPHLRSFAYCSHIDGTPNFGYDQVPLHLLAGQLVALHVDAGTSPFFTPHAHLLTNLELLDISYTHSITDRIDLLDRLPVNLRSLRMQTTLSRQVAPDSLGPFIFQHLKGNGYKSVVKLHELRLPGICAQVGRVVEAMIRDERSRKCVPIECLLSFDNHIVGVGAQLEEGDAQERLSLDRMFEPDFWAFVNDAKHVDDGAERD
ncbi:hypothetical protein P7C70_g8569, partial [Phenoliferia sp. Uapishka_3]